MADKFLLRNIGVTDSHRIAVYLARGGYQSWSKVVKGIKPAEVVDLVKRSGLRGRGGAGFPAGMKWSFVPKDSYPRYLVCNADEGEPGTCKDRVLMEQDPHAVLEGVAIACYAIEAHVGFIYVRGEFSLSAERLEAAIAEAKAQGYLGDDVLGSGFALDIVVHRGAGAYICGEETALLSSLEGERGNPRLKPPFPATEGLYRKPTVINNVETLANLPLIIERGPEWYTSMGTEKSPGVKLFALSGQVKRPGIYELPLGTPLRTLIEECGGGTLDDRPVKAVIPGGSSSPMLPAGQLDVTLDYEAIAAAGSMLGSGAVIVITEGTCMVSVARRLVEFYAHEDCGQCVPGREGIAWMAKILERIEAGHGREEDLDLLLDICDGLGGRSLCPLGDAAVGPVRSSIKHFRDDYLAHIHTGTCVAPTSVTIA
ncbi:MAG TPA: NADH-quinone oxidoreductase subunit NuoF [Anaerolineae bacterium]|nr:NADH-quinone oxidoreductase subunit NuoF [Anaerolineae bacterium]HOQ98383.1 NADH-quinone oxidoreductase subunit NuoF [Anaerolineae bacterium]